MSGEDTRLLSVDQLPGSVGEAVLVVIHAPIRSLLGARLALSGAWATLGRDQECDLVLDAEDVSRRHARVGAGDGGHVLEDLGSTNGSFVGGARVERKELASGDLVRLGSVLLKFLAGADPEQGYYEELRRLAQEDPLTGLVHRGAFTDALVREVARARRFRHPLSLALLDLDHFKAVNDRYGHPAGDHVLREVAGAVRPLVRAEQLLARIGGEELALLLPEVPLEKACLFAEKIRALVEARAFVHGEARIAVTVSIGLAAFEPADPDPDALLSRADARLYEAKRAGRNRVSC